MYTYQPGEYKEAQEENGFKAQVGPLAIVDVIELQDGLAIQRHIPAALELVAHLGVPCIADEVKVLIPEPVPGHAVGAQQEPSEEEQCHDICRQGLQPRNIKIQA